MEKTFRVRLEYTVITSEFADIEVDANNRQEAIAAAIEIHKNDRYGEIERYAGDDVSTSLDEHTKEDWNVSEE